ncbi:MAG: hypothetical protein NZ879_02435 [Archaeoglobaceae archaeon]|nr:hypothetical protein [Archaeoglobaceae archaeon]MDW8117822.1 hypothetical protein [Archaeoglobaceae archaeon]
MLENEELRALSGAVSEFIKLESEKESDVFKIWEKGFRLGYFDLSNLTLLESSTVFSTIHEIKPDLGSQLLYLSISEYAFKDKASLSFQSECGLITDWVQERYVLISDDVKMIKASAEFLTTEISKLKEVHVIEDRKVNIKPLVNVLLASRCIGTAIHAFNLALKYLKDIKLSRNYYHSFEKLGEISVDIRASELLIKASTMVESGEAEKISEMALWKSAITAVMAVDEAVLLQEGAYKYQEDFKVEVFRDLSKIKHRNPKTASVHDLKVSELYYPKTADFCPKI